MARYHVKKIVRDADGDVVPAVTVEVNQAGSETNQPIYSDAAGTPKANPLTSGSDGRYDLYVDEGVEVDFDFTKTGYTIPSENGLSVPLVSRSVTNVKDYPYLAAGDGVADDTAAIQAALDALDALGGGCLFFPRGQYNLSAQIDVPSNILLQGTGYGSRIHMTVADTQMFQVAGDHKVGFFALRLTGQGGFVTAGLGAIRLGLGSAGNGTDDSWVSGCWIEGVSNNGITIGSKSNRCRVTNTYIDQAGEENIYLLGVECVVTGCISRRAGQAGIKIASAINPLVVGNHFFDAGQHGMNVSGSTAGGVIANNIVLRSGFDGISFTENVVDMACVGNYVEASSQAADQTRDNIRVNSVNTARVFIDGNVCRTGALANGPRDGLRITAGTDIIVGDNDLRNGGKANQYTNAGTNTQGVQLKARIQPASGNTTLTAATDTDIAGCEISVTPLLSQTVVIHAVLDLTRVTADTLSIHLDVNGVNQANQLVMADSSRQPVTGFWVLSLAGGTAYTIKLQGVLQSGTGEWTVNSTGTKIALVPGGIP